jgi:hypothetical protein
MYIYIYMYRWEPTNQDLRVHDNGTPMLPKSAATGATPAVAPAVAPAAGSSRPRTLVADGLTH